ncbi:MAG: competence/damage-inducible protein A [Flavobacteriales bacterium]|nr:competence/damage-inducible protein A [Flavobacteriales bacterium]
MKSEIITIGDEILIGQIIDTNSAWMAQRLNEIGVDVVQITSISDTPEAIDHALDEARTRAQLILITGGLGPTNDDLTKLTLGKYFNSPATFRDEVFEDIAKLFREKGREITELNRQQAEVPEAAKVIRNGEGTAPGMWLDRGEYVVVSMPGVPYEMKAMFEHSVLPWTTERFKTPEIVHRTILTVGLPESILAAKLEDWEGNLPKEVKPAYLPNAGRARLRLSARGEDREVLSATIDEQVQKLHEIIGKYIYGEGNQTLEEVVGIELRKRGMSVATAESCTGGAIAAALTSIPGSSDYVMGGIIAYSNEVKVNQLEVPENDLLAHGAVSESIIQAMAQGARKKFKADFAVATSGIAGPDGGSDEKPIGTVWIAVAGPQRTWSKKYLFGTKRKLNVHLSVNAALAALRREILETV